jgi:hypothetical protein
MQIDHDAIPWGMGSARVVTSVSGEKKAIVTVPQFKKLKLLH